MRKIKDKFKKGKRLERWFAESLKRVFPSATTEFKPRVINLKKDFWGLFDGLTFIKSKKIYIFWQFKNHRISSKEKKKFWQEAKCFICPSVIVLLVERTDKQIKIYYNNKNYLNSLSGLRLLVKNK